MIHNRPELKNRRKDLRNNPTPAETLLWSVLQRSNLGGYKFRRQHSVGCYILDFYRPSEKPAVKLNGDSHFVGAAPEYDRARTAYLNDRKITVLRFLNTDVYDNLDAVCEKILAELKGGGGEVFSSPDYHPPAPPKIGGESMGKPVIK